MFAVSIFLCLTCLFLVAQPGSGCAFPGDIVSPCRCFTNSIECKGKQVTDSVLAAVFRNMSTLLPLYQQQIESFQLIDSNVKSITPKVFASVTIRGYIKLRGNQLTNFSIGNFDELFMLDVSSNRFRGHIPLDAFIGLKQLRALYAANIGMSTLKKEFFTHLPNLQRLDLGGNAIEVVEIDAFTSEYDNNFELRQIDLSHNRIRRLPENIFTVLRQPERINLANNQLERVTELFKFNRDMVQFAPVQMILSNNSIGNDHFSPDTFEHLVARQHYIDLDLSFNHLSFIEESVFGKLLHQETRSIIRLDHNPIQCTNCRNRWLIERASSPGGANFLDAISLPTCLENKKLSDLRLADFSHCN